jgi:hypothetical protein
MFSPPNSGVISHPQEPVLVKDVGCIQDSAVQADNKQSYFTLLNYQPFIPNRNSPNYSIYLTLFTFSAGKRTPAFPHLGDTKHRTHVLILEYQATSTLHATAGRMALSR